jgi:hypothetical protein
VRAEESPARAAGISGGLKPIRPRRRERGRVERLASALADLRVFDLPPMPTVSRTTTTRSLARSTPGGHAAVAGDRRMGAVMLAGGVARVVALVGPMGVGALV